MNDLVSIIIPTYNGEKYITKTVKSCLEQFHNNIEVIIIDDLSTDNTKDVLKNLTDSRIQVFYNEINLGISKNVNFGVSKAKGEYIILLGHDDMLPPFHVQNMLRAFTPKIGLVHCNSIHINDQDEVLKISKKNKRQIRKTKKPLQTLAIKNFIQSCGMMFRRSSFLKVGGWDESYKLYGEWLLYTKLATICDFAYTSSTFGYYRKHKTNISKDIAKNQKQAANQYYALCRKTAYENSNKTPLLIFRYYKQKLKSS